jgi:hypothetical protein
VSLALACLLLSHCPFPAALALYPPNVMIFESGTYAVVGEEVVCGRLGNFYDCWLDGRGVANLNGSKLVHGNIFYPPGMPTTTPPPAGRDPSHRFSPRSRTS